MSLGKTNKTTNVSDSRSSLRESLSDPDINAYSENSTENFPALEPLAQNTVPANDALDYNLAINKNRTRSLVDSNAIYRQPIESEYAEADIAMEDRKFSGTQLYLMQESNVEELLRNQSFQLIQNSDPESRNQHSESKFNPMSYLNKQKVNNDEFDDHVQKSLPELKKQSSEHLKSRDNKIAVATTVHDSGNDYFPSPDSDTPQSQPHVLQCKGREGDSETGRLESSMIICLACDKVFHSNENLRLHMHTYHSKTKLYTCTYCFKNFKTNYKMDLHVREVHLKERNIPCSVGGCNEKFFSTTKMQRHVRFVHLQQRNFECSRAGCASRFGQESDLKRHTELVHNNIRPFQCHTCTVFGVDKSHFSRRSSVRHHLRSIHLMAEDEIDTCFEDACCYIQGKIRFMTVKPTKPPKQFIPEARTQGPISHGANSRIE